MTITIIGNNIVLPKTSVDKSSILNEISAQKTLSFSFPIAPENNQLFAKRKVKRHKKRLK